jgi:hypothetical protein
MKFMKSVLLTSVVKLEKKELRDLCKEVKETVATGYAIPAKDKANFNLVDLWKVQQNMKRAGRSRKLFVRG